jgi:hypothetical protein
MIDPEWQPWLMAVVQLGSAAQNCGHREVRFVGLNMDLISPIHPPPRISDLYLQTGPCRLPAQKCAGTSGVSDQDRGLPGRRATICDRIGRRQTVSAAAAITSFTE